MVADQLVFYCEPVVAPKSGGYGDWYPDGRGGWYQHRAVDYDIGAGNPWKFPAPGVSVRFTNDGTFGKYACCIEHDHVPNFPFRFSLYAHGSALYVPIGARVEAGQVGGLTGHEGAYPGQYADHLHWQLSNSPAFSTRLEDSMDPMSLVLTEEEMDRLQRLEGLMERVIYAGWGGKAEMDRLLDEVQAAPLSVRINDLQTDPLLNEVLSEEAAENANQGGQAFAPGITRGDV